MTIRESRAGADVIYYRYVEASRISLLLWYAKDERDDLGPEQKRTRRRVVAED